MSRLEKAPSVPDACQRLLGAKPTSYGGMIDEGFSLKVDNKGRSVSFRGSSCALNVDEVSLPPAGTLLLPTTDIAEEVNVYLRCWHTRMLRDNVTSEELKVHVVYQEPIHRNKSVKLTLAEWP